MKRLIAIVFLIVAVIISPNIVNADLYQVISSNFTISGSIDTFNVDPIDDFHISYSKISSAPLLYDFGGNSSVYSEAALGKVEARRVAANHFIGENSKGGNTTAGAYAETSILFKPLFSGEGARYI